MKARTALLITAAAALFVGALETPSHAAQAKWKQMQYWTVVGDPSTPYCGAWSTFKDGTTLHISLNNTGWLIAVQGVNAIPGKQYQVGMATNHKDGILYGEGVSRDTVAFTGMAPESVAELAKTRQLYIAGLGTFNLKGSYGAVVEIMNCYGALSGEAL